MIPHLRDIIPPGRGVPHHGVKVHGGKTRGAKVRGDRSRGAGACRRGDGWVWEQTEEFDCEDFPFNETVGVRKRLRNDAGPFEFLDLYLTDQIM